MCLRMVGLSLILLSGIVNAAELRFSLVRTAQTTTSSEYAWRDGGWVEPPPVNHIAVLIEHRGSRLLFGTGLGRQIDQQLDSEIPWREKRYSAVQPVREQLDRDHLVVDRVVLGCARWEYASGLADFADLPVLASSESIHYARHATPPAVLPTQFAHGVRWQPLHFDQRPFYGFEESLDLFGDERLVLVKLPGHGALGLFLTLDDGRRFFFRGDAALAESDPKPLPAEVAQMQDVQRQEQLGFYPRWIE
ncbi:Zn-dependent hydrolase [Pseudomonas sp. KSR10]|jgi:glyoxylase-like metal-dependent hydrolase (beta-lactamase superfamily II)|uniref:Zn-dependent hydrolase n=1 Tax=unclassified Pseudomonas TaxID=196821 RepID=UPI001EF8581E|nr:Zn-dependent hydrolase [Pseudomonas sp. KSR10]MCG6538612.1 Zn-dependent hydrolase [Pseudomonas sp. KSR10]